MSIAYFTKYKVVAYQDYDKDPYYVLSLENKGCIEDVKIAKSNMKQDDLDILMENDVFLAAVVVDKRIHEWHVL